MLAAILLVLPAQGSTQIHKWLDERGHVHYADRPPPGTSQPGISPRSDTAAPEAPARGTTAPVAMSDRPMVADPDSGAPPTGPLMSMRKMLLAREFTALEGRIAELERAFAADYASEDALFEVLDVFDVWGDTLEASLEAWVAASPGRYQPYLARAAFRFAQGWNARGSDWASETSAAQFAGMESQFARALPDLATALRLNPRSVLPHYIRINVAVAASRRRDAEEALAQALALRPGSYRIRNSFLNGLKPRWGGSYPDMRRFVLESEAFSRLNPRLRHLSGEILADMASAARSARQPSEADRLYSKALELGEEHGWLAGRARVRHGLKRFPEALADIDRAIAIEPEKAGYHHTRAEILGKQAQFHDALSAIERAHQLDPLAPYIRSKYKWIASTLGYETHQRGDATGAVRHFERAIEMAPEDADLYYRRSRALADAQHYRESLADVERAIELDPDQIRFFVMVDWLLFRERQLERIIAHWDDFISRHPDSSRAFLERAGTHFHKGDLAAARRDAQTAAEMGNVKAQELARSLGRGAP